MIDITVPAESDPETIAATGRIRAWLRDKYRDKQPQPAAEAPRKIDAPIACFPVAGGVSDCVQKGRNGQAALRRAKRGTKTRAQVQPCSVPDCGKGQHSGGLCAAHDIEARRAGIDWRQLVAERLAARVEQEAC